MTEKLRKRNKLIKIANSSEGGRKTGRQYETNLVASDTDVESKNYKANSRAVRKRENKRNKRNADKRPRNDSRELPPPIMFPDVSTSLFVGRRSRGAMPDSQTSVSLPMPSDSQAASSDNHVMDHEMHVALSNIGGTIVPFTTPRNQLPNQTQNDINDEDLKKNKLKDDLASSEEAVLALSFADGNFASHDKKKDEDPGSVSQEARGSVSQEAQGFVSQEAPGSVRDSQSDIFK